MKNIYFKQEKLLSRQFQPKKYIYGCGSIGSHVLFSLSKMGFENLTAYDMDIVEDSNIPAQMFDIQSKTFKTVEIARIVKGFSGIDIDTVNVMITNDFIPNMEKDSIHILAFDNIEARKIIFNKLKGLPVYIIDGRIGGFNYEIYSFRCTDEEACAKYEKTLQGEFTELECGEKCLFPVNSLIAAKISAKIILLSKDKKLGFVEKGNLLSKEVISDDRN